MATVYILLLFMLGVSQAEDPLADIGLPNRYNVTMTVESSDEKRLVNHLVDVYKYLGTAGRPVKDYSRRLLVEVALHLVQILDLDEHNQVLTSSIRSDLVWHDDFLSWDPGEYSNINDVGLRPAQLWVPDIILSNSVSEEEMIDNYNMVRVENNGSVTWSQRTVYKTSCQIDMQNYPFDRQRCHLLLKSSSYVARELDLSSLYEEDINLLEIKKHHILREYIEASEWNVVEVKMIEDWSDTTPMDTMRYTIVLQRKLVFFTYILIFPCVFLTILTLVIFWLPPERPDKTTLAMSIFGSFTVLLLVLVGSIPSTASSVPILGVYYFFNMVITAFSIILACIIINISRSNKQKPRVPRWLRLIAIETLGSMFGVYKNEAETFVERKLRLKREQELREKKQREEDKQLKRQREQEEKKMMKLQRLAAKMAREREEARKRQLEKERAEKGTEGAENVDNLKSFEESIGESSSDAASTRINFGISDINLSGMDKNAYVDERLLNVMEHIDKIAIETRDLISSIQTYNIERENKHEMRDEKITEWHIVAVAIDRLFFCIYMAIIIILLLVSSCILFPRAF